MRFSSLWAARAAVCAIALEIGGCSTPAVGAPCLPEHMPDNGFDSSESYIEASSVQCETRVCLVYQLAGAPAGTGDCKLRPNCQDCNGGDRDCVPDCCADEAEVERRVYCTCRCDGSAGDSARCTCPSGFSCAPVLEQGDVGVRGSYCVRDGTVNRQ